MIQVQIYENEKEFSAMEIECDIQGHYELYDSYAKYTTVEFSNKIQYVIYINYELDAISLMVIPVHKVG